MARDLGMSRGELSVLAGKWPDAADLLSRRLEQVNLAAVAIEDLERPLSEGIIAGHPTMPRSGSTRIRFAT
jgi:hypothetical protein